MYFASSRAEKRDKIPLCLLKTGENKTGAGLHAEADRTRLHTAYFIPPHLEIRLIEYFPTRNKRDPSELDGNINYETKLNVSLPFQYDLDPRDERFTRIPEEFSDS